MTIDVKQLTLEQGADEWHEWRREHYTASEAAIVMGCAPDYWAVRTPDQLRRVKETGNRPKLDLYTHKLFADGHAMEEKMRPAGVEPACFSRGKYGASLDGWDPAFGQWYEIKAPQSRSSMTYRVATQFREVAVRSRIPDHYWWQLVHQAYCVPDDATQCLFIVAPIDGTEAVPMVVHRSVLMEDWPKLEGAWEAFDAAIPNVPDEDDELLAREYMEALHEHDLAKARLDRAKAAVLAAGPRTIEGLVEITQSEVRGRIDYKSMAEHHGIDAEEQDKWRGETRARTAIKLIGDK